MTTEQPDIEIGIRTPLPLDVSSTIIRAIGAVYPGAKIRTDGRRNELTLLIPDAERNRQGRKRDIVKALVEPDEHTRDANFEGFDDGSVRFSTPEDASLALGTIAKAMLDADGTTNYLEASVHDEEGNTYVVCAARSSGQTPHALRLAAEARADRAESRLAELETTGAAR